MLGHHALSEAPLSATVDSEISAGNEDQILLADTVATDVLKWVNLDLVDNLVITDNAQSDVLRWVLVDASDQILLTDAGAVSGLLLVNGNPVQQIYRPRILVTLAAQRYSTEDIEV